MENHPIIFGLKEMPMNLSVDGMGLTTHLTIQMGDG
jgi:hypothetical protein